MSFTFSIKSVYLDSMNSSHNELTMNTSLIIPQVETTLTILVDRMAKITQAVLLVSSVVPDKQQLLDNFSRKSISLLSAMQNIESCPEQVQRFDIDKLLVSLRHVTQLNDLCHGAGLISDMNYQILTNEFQKIITIIDKQIVMYCIGQVTYPFRAQQTTIEQKQVSLEHYFSDTPETKINKNIEPVKKDILINTDKDSILFKKDITPTPHTKLIEPDSHNKTSTVISSSYPSPIKPVNGEDKKERRDTIMKTIRSKGKVTIKDISENISGCSEKTIQRDLQELIQHGVLIREGEKRWAVYKLAMKNI